MVGQDGATPLFLAAQNGHIAVVSQLLAYDGVDPTIARHDGDTPLIMAA